MWPIKHTSPFKLGKKIVKEFSVALFSQTILSKYQQQNTSSWLMWRFVDVLDMLILHLSGFEKLFQKLTQVQSMMLTTVKAFILKIPISKSMLWLAVVRLVKDAFRYRSVLSNWEFFIKMRAAFLALSFLHNSHTTGWISKKKRLREQGFLFRTVIKIS